MVRRTLILVSCLLACIILHAQQTLNIHTTTQGTVSIAFAETPVITLTTPEVLTVTSEKMTVEFPFTEVLNITLEDTPDAVSSLVERDGIAVLRIYDLSGRMVSQTLAKDDSVALPLSVLKPGIYIVSDGKRSYKIRLQ